MSKTNIILQLMLLLICIMPAFSQQDVPGSKDHPIISRYPGSFIYHYEQKEFDEFEILLGPIKGSSDRDMQLAKRKNWKVRSLRSNISAHKTDHLLKYSRIMKKRLKKLD